ncbi:MAG: hypothetical protein BZ136_09615 [Methanosphaera sp. rholeuAM74]|nr:MAG: hypothetical protein BZ136_09615 [Methanosphaera sp. rholeuAM74]
MEDWFDTFSRQYFEHDYRYHYNYNHHRQLRPYNDIKAVEIDGNVLSGRISHGKYDFNRVTIGFREFTCDEKDKLRRIVDDNAVNTFKVVNKTLPEELFSAGIEILPRSLDDLEVECSYDNNRDNLIDSLSLLKEFNRRMEKNNFLIFLTRNITYPVKTLEDIFSPKFRANSEDATLTDLYDVNMTLLRNVEHPSKSFDFIYDDLFGLLNNEIESFPNKYNPHTTYMDYVTDTKTSIRSKRGKNEYFMERWDVSKPITFNVGDDYDITNSNQFKSGTELFTFLNEAGQVECEYLDERTLYLRQLLELTYSLVKHNSVMPEIFKTDTSYHIRWIPSFYSSNVINYCRKYYDNCPDDLVTFNNEALTKENQVVIMISLLMKGLIRYVIDKNNVRSFENIPNTTFKLFTGKKLKNENNKYQSTVENIQRQLSAFYLNELEYSYAMFIDDSLDIEIRIKEDGHYKSISEASVDQLKNMKKVYDLFTYYKIENKNKHY